MKEQESFIQLVVAIQKVLIIKLVGTLPDGEDELENIKIVVPLKNLSNFMFNLDFFIISSEIELILKWTEDSAVNVPSDLKFSITDCKMYVPVVNLQTQYQNQLYKELKTGISIDFKWSKYRSQMINQSATNNLNF